MRKRLFLFSLLAVPLICLLAGLAYNLPPIHDRLGWRVASWRTRIWHTIKPPEQVVFVPEQQQQVEAIVEATLQAWLHSATPSPVPTVIPTIAGPTTTPLPSPTPTMAPTPIPGEILLTGVTHEYQQLNNCGPATLSMALSFWGWKGDQRDTRSFLRPNFEKIDDKNVMPAEMVTYVETQVGLKALARVGGDLDLLKRLVAAGFPVIVEKGFQPPGEFWMGHYELFTGYDDSRARFITQDAYIMSNFPVPYEELSEHWWRDFNYAYVVLYPAEREADLFSVLGPQADEIANVQHAAEVAAEETANLTGRDLFFAWYNLGSSRVALQDYAGAAEAFDQAFAIYPTIPDQDRPWRILWYQTGPYEAYYQTGRYQDVVNLANTTLSVFAPPEIPGLEETYYWLGLAREGQGELEMAVSDLKKAVEINPGSTPALEQLKRLGVAFP